MQPVSAPDTSARRRPFTFCCSIDKPCDACVEAIYAAPVEGDRLPWERDAAPANDTASASPEVL